MRFTLRRCLTTTIPLLSLLAVACGGSTVEATGAVDIPQSIDVTDDAGGSASGSGDPRELDDYLGSAAAIVRNGTGGGRAGPGTVGVDAEQIIEEQRLIELEIQMCMQNQGFTYVPEDPGDGLNVFLQAEADAVSPADYAATEGFGISTRFDAIFEGEIDLSEDSDPNAEHLATLGPGEADAWQLALAGEPPQRNEAGQLVDPETGEVLQGSAQRGATGGCQLEARTSVRGDFSALSDLSAEFAELSDRIESDPRVAELRRQWTDCMRTAGFDYEDESEARADMQAQLRPFLRSLFASTNDGVDAAGGGTGGGQRAGGGNLVQAVAGLQLSPEQEVELDALQDLERSIAIASHECAGDSAEEIDAITATYEAEFVEANRDALEAIDS